MRRAVLRPMERPVARAAGSSGAMDVAGALVKAVNDVDSAVYFAIRTVLYLLGVVAFVQGCLRLLRRANEGVAGQSLWGAVASFAIAAVFVSIPEVLRGAGETFFGGETAVSAALGYGGRAVDYEPLLQAVTWIVRMVGLLSFAKGMYVLRGASDGVPGATVSGAAMHLVGGAMAWHILVVLEAVQETLGISVLRIT